MLAKVWGWLRVHWRWLLVVPALVVGILAWRKGGSIASAILGKDKPIAPKPGTLTEKEGEEATADVKEEAQVARIKLQTGRAAVRADDDDWLCAGGNHPGAKPPKG